MQLAAVQTAYGPNIVAVGPDGLARPLRLDPEVGVACLADIFHADDPAGLAASLVDPNGLAVPLSSLTVLAPIDRQEVWAAGVTYKRSKVAREEESAGAAQFYDKVYTAPRPELFLKATPGRVTGPGGPIRVRADSRWSVPEPEVTLVVSPRGDIVGFTVGNDVSSRDIEGENPLYMPQAKIYRGSCAIGPVVTLAGSMPPLAGVTIRLEIRRAGRVAFDGSTTLASLNRTPESLVEWLFRENEFPDGVLLLTGTGIVPPDDFTLTIGDEVAITIDGIGTLTNRVAA